MRCTRALLGLVLVSVAGLEGRAQNSGQMYTATRQQLDVTKVVLAQENAWNRGDLDGYLSFYKQGDDSEAILNGPVHGIQAIRNAYHLSFPNREAMGLLEQSSVEVREMGPGFALVLGHYKLSRTRKNGGDAEGNFTEVFEKTDQGWRLVFSENT